MRSSAERFRERVAVPQVFVVVAVLACGLLTLLESRTPWRSTVILVGGRVTGVETAARPEWGLIASALLVLAPLLALRSMLAGVLLVLPRLSTGIAAELAWPWTAYAALVAVAVCGSWRRPGAAVLVSGLGLLVPLAAIWTRGDLMRPGGSVHFGPLDRGMWELVSVSAMYVVATVLLMLLAVLLRHEGARERDVRDLLRGRREVQLQSAVLDERSRLARDLHDVVAHHVSLIAVRAETAPFTHADLSKDARTAFADIAEEARLALHELRGVLGVLRRSEEAQRAPQPTAARIEHLVSFARATSPQVSASLRDLEQVHPTPGYVAFRVVQEALTNARRHAPNAVVDVVAHGDESGGIVVRVSNPVGDEAKSWERGQGVTGMDERVTAAGGRLDIGCRNGAFVVQAQIPGSTDPSARARGDDG